MTGNHPQNHQRNHPGQNERNVILSFAPLYSAHLRSVVGLDMEIRCCDSWDITTEIMIVVILFNNEEQEFPYI